MATVRVPNSRRAKHANRTRPASFGRPFPPKRRRLNKKGSPSQSVIARAQRARGNPYSPLRQKGIKWASPSHAFLTKGYPTFSLPGIFIVMWDSRKTAFAAKSGLSDSPKTTRGLRAPGPRSFNVWAQGPLNLTHPFGDGLFLAHWHRRSAQCHDLGFDVGGGGRKTFLFARRSFKTVGEGLAPPAWVWYYGFVGTGVLAGPAGLSDGFQSVWQNAPSRIPALYGRPALALPAV